MLRRDGVEYVSSRGISDAIGVDASQIAKDLSHLGLRGKTRIGYEVAALERELRGYLGFDIGHNAVIVGVGSLGGALIQDRGLQRYGLNIVAGIDVNADRARTQRPGRRRPPHGRRRARHLELHPLPHTRARRSDSHQYIHIFPPRGDVQPHGQRLAMKTLLVSLTTGKLQLRQVPDSALLTGGRPLFLPEHLTGTDLTVLPAVRISRLGLAVSERFADRYFDATTLVALNVPLSGADETDFVADNALVVGQWQPLPADGTWTAALPGDPAIASMRLHDSFVAAVSAVSQRSTLKTGDIIALLPGITTIHAGINDRVELTLNDSKVLDFKIK